MHARVVLGVGKGVLFREVSSVQKCPLEGFHSILSGVCVCVCVCVCVLQQAHPEPGRGGGGCVSGRSQSSESW